MICLASYECGLRIVGGAERVHEAWDYDALRVRLLEDPVAPADVWQTFLSLRSDIDDRRRDLARYAQEQHWESAPPPVPEEDADGRSELDWHDLWRRHNPRQQEAWCGWSRMAADALGPGVVIDEMESALAADPENGAVRHCLLEALYRVGDAVRVAEIEDQGGPVGDAEQEHSFLPEAFRWRFAFELRQPGTEGLMAVLQQARRERPDDVRIEIVELDFERTDASVERELEIEARLLELTRAPQPLPVLGELCEVLWSDDDAFEACWDRFTDRVVTGGFHLASTPVPPSALGPDLEDWDSRVYRARERLLGKAKDTNDLDFLVTLLLDGPGYGYGELWRKAIDARDMDRATEQAIELQDRLCRALDLGVREGRLDRPIVDAVTTCPGRAADLLEVMEDCGLKQAAEDLRAAVGEQLSQLPAEALRSLGALDPAARALEIERRLAVGALSNGERAALERDLTGLLVELEDRDRLRRQGLRLVAREGRLGPQVRGWLERVDREDGEALVPILRELVARVPKDRMLRLRLAFEALRGDPADPAAVRHFAGTVAEDPGATVRERAEASFLLGRAALLEGRPEAATPLLERFYRARIVHAGCPAEQLFCDRDFMLHLIAVGDTPRLDAYRRFRAGVLSAFRAEIEAMGRGDEADTDLARSGWPVLLEDELMQRTFLDPGCGLPGAVPHLEALALQRPDDPKLRERLERERRRTCVQADGPFPFAASPSPFESPPPRGWLLAAEYPAGP
ncbi:MAG: hypothetical protein AAGD06_28970 [Acidobacteriota bacterium]